MTCFTGGGIDNSQIKHSLNSSNQLSFFTKKTFLSLATISFLASYANANIISDHNHSSGTIQITSKNQKNISGGNCSGTNCTISNEQNQQITISGSNGGTLTVESSGVINGGNGVFVGNKTNNVTIENQGNINGNTSGIKTDAGKIDTITNSGTIQGGSHYGMYINVGATVDNINNTGMITGQTGIHVESNSKVGTINNSGTINGVTRYGVVAYNGSYTDTLNNQGKIYGKDFGILVQNNSSIKTIKNQGSIIGDYGVYLYGNSSIQAINNQGLIFGDRRGIYMHGAGTAINHIKAEGKMPSLQEVQVFIT
ncbi:hypothetical protein [Campylobacter sp. 2014D-0216]|uniref:hypothetical protein n=1 Tax=Campylobacter sp. 2014D-0216 TaxID=1813595 RepID=UPI0018A63E4A|nr:hypothetical protein [Campylobacter sp. 2014D-0216]QOR01840.1 hypothetical protein A0083_03680 [Campylobacter sp. 2014D-0216]